MERRDFLITGGLGLAAVGAGALVVGREPALAEPASAASGALPQSARKRGILGRQAPNLDVSTWYRLPKGKASVDLNDFKGDVVYLYFFQSWCPGCHKAGFPTLQKVSRHFSRTPGVSFAAVQTVFEGFGTNTAAKAKAMAERYDLRMPVGHDAGPNDSGSRVMRRYRSGGTPWTVIMDKRGIVRFNAFHIRPDAAITFIEKLRRAA